MSTFAEFDKLTLSILQKTLAFVYICIYLHERRVSCKIHSIFSSNETLNLIVLIL